MIRQEFEYKGKNVELFLTPRSGLTVIVLSYGREGESLWRFLQEEETVLNLVVLSGLKWNDELSPWPQKGVVKGDPGYQGNADSFLSFLVDDFLPYMMKAHSLEATSFVLEGYSLAGLFALYAGHRTDAFDALISTSGSLWFPHFAEYVQENVLKTSVRYVGLSLGDKEAMTRNEIMCTVASCTQTIERRLQQQTHVEFEWNEGGHFGQEIKRQGNAIRRYMNWLKRQAPMN